MGHDLFLPPHTIRHCMVLRYKHGRYISHKVNYTLHLHRCSTKIKQSLSAITGCCYTTLTKMHISNW
jgi:hypothetical protein